MRRIMYRNAIQYLRKNLPLHHLQMRLGRFNHAQTTRSFLQYPIVIVNELRISRNYSRLSSKALQIGKPI